MSQPRGNLAKHSEGGSSKGTHPEVGMRVRVTPGALLSVRQAGVCQGCGLCVKSHRNHGMDAKMQGRDNLATMWRLCSTLPLQENAV